MTDTEKTIDEIERIKEHIRSSSEVFEEFCIEDNGFKGHNLGKWLKKKSELLKHYEAAKNNKKIKKFKRGSLIFADFGVNIGSEYCGPHFAIVLNKDDTIHNRTLTVIPLTSAKPGAPDNPRRVKVGYSVPNVILKSIEIEQDELAKMTEKIRVFLEELRKSIERTKHTNDESSEVSRIKSVLVKHGYNNRGIKRSKNLQDLTNEVGIINKRIGVDLKKIKEILDRYKDTEKESLILPYSITTIDKVRLYDSINEFDPVGGSVVSPELMEVISKCIQTLYLD